MNSKVKVSIDANDALAIIRHEWADFQRGGGTTMNADAFAHHVLNVLTRL